MPVRKPDAWYCCPPVWLQLSDLIFETVLGLFLTIPCRLELVYRLVFLQAPIFHVGVRQVGVVCLGASFIVRAVAGQTCTQVPHKRQLLISISGYSLNCIAPNVQLSAQIPHWYRYLYWIGGQKYYRLSYFLFLRVNTSWIICIMLVASVSHSIDLLLCGTCVDTTLVGEAYNPTSLLDRFRSFSSQHTIDCCWLYASQPVWEGWSLHFLYLPWRRMEEWFQAVVWFRRLFYAKWCCCPSGCQFVWVVLFVVCQVDCHFGTYLSCISIYGHTSEK